MMVRPEVDNGETSVGSWTEWSFVPNFTVSGDTNISTSGADTINNVHNISDGTCDRTVWNEELVLYEEPVQSGCLDLVESDRCEHDPCSLTIRLQKIEDEMTQWQTDAMTQRIAVDIENELKKLIIDLSNRGAEFRLDEKWWRSDELEQYSALMLWEQASDDQKGRILTALGISDERTLVYLLIVDVEELKNAFHVRISLRKLGDRTPFTNAERESIIASFSDDVLPNKETLIGLLPRLL